MGIVRQIGTSERLALVALGLIIGVVGDVLGGPFDPILGAVGLVLVLVAIGVAEGIVALSGWFRRRRAALDETG